MRRAWRFGASETACDAPEDTRSSLAAPPGRCLDRRRLRLEVAQPHHGHRRVDRTGRISLLAEHRSISGRGCRPDRHLPRVAEGRVTSITESDWTILEGHSVGELGFGTNPNAPREQLGSVSEKAIGTAHLGIGSNDFLGGTTSEGIHIDVIVEDPALWIDGVEVDLSDIRSLS